MHAAPKRFVYLLSSTVTGQLYVGLTSDVSMRLAAHNAKNRLTARHRDADGSRNLIVYTI